MKTLCLFICVISFSLKGLSQHEEINQPDSIYKANGVKSRITTLTNRVSTNYIETYDKDGHHIESAHTDTSLKNYITKTVFKYDSEGKLTNEYSYFYYRKDNITKKEVLRPDNPLVLEGLNVKHDSLNRVIRKTMRTQEGKLLDEITYTYNPLIIKEKHWNKRDLSINREIEKIYEADNISKRVWGSNFRNNKKYDFDFSYENTFDESGRLIKRIYSRTDSSCRCLGNSPILSEITYEYNKGGLLIQRAEISYWNNRTRKETLLFEYKYW